jgi:hypothetical protein
MKLICWFRTTFPKLEREEKGRGKKGEEEKRREKRRRDFVCIQGKIGKSSFS